MRTGPSGSAPGDRPFQSTRRASLLVCTTACCPRLHASLCKTAAYSCLPAAATCSAMETDAIIMHAIRTSSAVSDGLCPSPGCDVHSAIQSFSLGTSSTMPGVLNRLSAAAVLLRFCSTGRNWRAPRAWVTRLGCGHDVLRPLFLIDPDHRIVDDQALDADANEHH